VMVLALVAGKLNIALGVLQRDTHSNKAATLRWRRVTRLEQVASEPATTKTGTTKTIGVTTMNECRNELTHDLLTDTNPSSN
jgi:hypothetical protein